MMTRASKSRPLALDLFCGIGGLSLGLHRGGIDTIGGVDAWEESKATFEHNLAPLKCLTSDLTRTTVDEIEDFFGISTKRVDIVAGGPPCQGFSTVGKRDALDPRNKLWTHFRDLVGEIRPAYIIIENVEGMLVMQNGRVRDSVIRGFAEVGYRMKCKLLRASDYGVPQLRKRTFFLGWLPQLAEPFFPYPTTSARPVTVAEAIYDLPALDSGERADHYDGPAKTEYQRARRGRVKRLHNHEAARHPESLIEVLRHIPDGGNRKSIPDHLQPRSGFHNSYARLASNKPAIAVTSNMRKPSSARSTHPLQPRGLTVREGLRLQSFDDDFVVLGSRTSQYLQVGNAVPPLMAEAVAREIAKALATSGAAAVRRARSARPVKVRPELDGEPELELLGA